MIVQVLVATMNQEDYSLLSKMNIQTDAIIGNQCGRNEVDSFLWDDKKIVYLNFNERGVGLNRNNALMRANADICVLADDDMRFFDNYSKVVEKEFERLPKADVIIFNIKEKIISRYVNKKTKRVGKLSFFKYGAARIAFRLKSIREKGIFFNQCFGGGTDHSAGEDTLFLSDCLRKGLRIYSVNSCVAELLDDRESSWFKGYNEKFFLDKGFLFKTLSPVFWRMLCLQDSIRHMKLYGASFTKTYPIMISGGKNK